MSRQNHLAAMFSPVWKHKRHINFQETFEYIVFKNKITHIGRTTHMNNTHIRTKQIVNQVTISQVVNRLSITSR